MTSHGRKSLLTNMDFTIRIYQAIQALEGTKYTPNENGIGPIFLACVHVLDSNNQGWKKYINSYLWIWQKYN